MPSIRGSGVVRALLFALEPGTDLRQFPDFLLLDAVVLGRLRSCMLSQRQCNTIREHSPVRDIFCSASRKLILSYIDTLYVDLSRFNGSPVAKVQTHMKYWMDKASWHKPSILVLDNIDKLMGTELEVSHSIHVCWSIQPTWCPKQHADSFHTRHITELFLGLYGSSSRSTAPNASGVVLLAAAESQASLHPLLNSSHRFQEVVNLKPPSKDARKEVCASLPRMMP